MDNFFKCLSSMSVKGFKSIKSLEDFNMKNLNIIIGANGVGKSNFINIFKILNCIVKQQLQTYVAQKGFAEKILFFGSKKTGLLEFKFKFGYGNRYDLKLIPDQANSLLIEEEIVAFCQYQEILINKPTEESKLKEGLISEIRRTKDKCKYVNDAIASWRIYHFHDTGDSSSIKTHSNINDNTVLHSGGANLASFLYSIKDTVEYQEIVAMVKRVAPFFQDFILEPEKNNSEQIKLCWRHKETLEGYFDSNDLSDGTLRFICLITVLLQPNPPAIIILDEPELGLHPYALEVLAGVFRSVSSKTQIIASTQSVTFANQFNCEDIIVSEQKKGESFFKRLSEEDCKDWLDDFNIGDIWEKNIIGGVPND